MIRFYFYVRPCRPVKEWLAGRAIIRALHPAAVRKSYDGEGLEFIGRCDGAQVAPLYDNRAPWVQIYLGDYPVPPSPNLWTGDPNTDCTGPLLRC